MTAIYSAHIYMPSFFILDANAQHVPASRRKPSLKKKKLLICLLLVRNNC